MPTMAEVRAKFPQYDDMDDATLAGALHSKFYSDIPRAEFNAKIGLAPETADPLAIAAAKPEGEGAASRLGATALGAADAASFSLGDEIGAGLGAASEYIGGMITGAPARSYSELKAAMNKQDETAQEAHPGYYMGGQIAGAVAGGAGLAKGGLSLAANAAQRGSSLARVAGASAVDGAILNGISEAGKGEGLADRATRGAIGVGVGAGLGLAAPVAVAGVSALAKPLIAPVAARLRPQSYSNAALGEALKRAGATPDDVARQLSEAAADGQGAFTVADALGNSGQRMLSTVTRTPNNARQGVTEQLMKRQAGQGRRLQNALEEGFGSPQTKAQTEAALTALRQTEAGVNYGAARSSAGSVNPTSAIAKADDFLGAGGSLPATDIASDSVAGAVKRARALLTDGNNVISDFPTAFRAKVELDSMIDGGNKTVQSQLIPIRNELDQALEKASPTYANARNTFRRQSQDIEAADLGRQSAMRGRVEDTVPRFQALTRPEQQASFRAGYVDPYIETLQGTPGTMTNKVRPLLSDATETEFPMFAQPGKADQLSARLAREQRMFETQTQALGGSKTADNLADMEDMANFDPAVISRLLRGDIVGAGLASLTKAMNEAKGLPPSVLERVAKGLTETNPDAARKMLQIAATKSLDSLGRQKAATTILRSIGTVAGPSSPAP